MILDFQADTIQKRKLNTQRKMSFIKLVTTQSDDEDEKKLFTANINEELPNNKLIDQLRNGLTLYVQRMQMRECFYATI